MIGEIIKQLQKDNYYGGGEYIEIAKGKHEMVTTWKGGWRKFKRNRKARK